MGCHTSYGVPLGGKEGGGWGKCSLKHAGGRVRSRRKDGGSMVRRPNEGGLVVNQKRIGSSLKEQPTILNCLFIRIKHPFIRSIHTFIR